MVKDEGINSPFGFVGLSMNAGFNPFYPDFREVKSIYVKEDGTLMLNTKFSTVFLKGEVIDKPSGGGQ